MSNGVRNLRAMFENSNAASSPEPRGRSPVDSSAPTDSSDRPKSKVRASFVPVEPTTAAHNSTDLGQNKGTPTNSLNAHRRESFSVNEDRVDELAELKKVVSDEREERRKSVAIPEAVPEQAVASRESSAPAPLSREEIEANDMPNLGSIMKGSDFPQAAGTDDPVPVPELEKVGGADTPAQPEETAIEEAELSPMPSPEPTPAQPAQNPDKATTGAQEDLALRPAVPTDEAVVEDDTPAQKEAAVQKDIPAAEEAAIEEAAVAEAAIADEQVAAAEEAAIVEEEAPSALPVGDAQPAENPDKPVTGAQEEVALRPAAPTDAAAVTEETPASETSKPADSKAKANGTAAAKKPETKKPATISTAKPKTPSTAAKSPLPKPAPKTPPKPKAATPAAKPSPAKASKPAAQPKPTAPKEPVKAPATKAPAAKAPAPKAPVAKTSRSSLRPAAASSSATAPTASAASKAKLTAPSAESKKPAAPKPAAPAPRKSTSPSGFKKPAPKSPTRPVGLPSRLTAPTAASAAKHGEEPKVEQKVTRKPSTTTRAAPKPAAPRASRPSVAPSAPKRPESRTSTVGSAPKGGFLERMMRPTAASSSKTHEKPHEKATSPPRKPAASKPSTLQKGKKKVEDVAAKAKAAVTNGHRDEEHKDEEHKDEAPKAEEEAPKESEPAEQATEEAPTDEASHEPTKAATPVQDVDSSTAELQTPNFQGEGIR